MKENYTWHDFGRYFGFPECCIESFSTLEHVGGPPRKLYGTGYIPCPECNKKTKRQLLATIKKTRLARKPFPEEESWKDMISHMNLIKQFKLNQSKDQTLSEVFSLLKSSIKGRVVNGNMEGCILESELKEIYEQLRK